MITELNPRAGPAGIHWIHWKSSMEVPAPHLCGSEDGAPHLLAVVPHAIYSHIDH